MSFLFGKQKETEREEYERLLKEVTERESRIQRWRESMMKDMDARMAPLREREDMIKKLEEKFNPNN